MGKRASARTLYRLQKEIVLDIPGLSSWNIGAVQRRRNAAPYLWGNLPMQEEPVITGLCRKSAY